MQKKKNRKGQKLFHTTVLVYCTKYKIQRMIMIKDIEGTGRGLKNILDCSRSRQGLKYFICFLTKMGLITRI